MSVSSFSIRPYREMDLDAVTVIWLESWKSTGVAVAQTATLEPLRKRFPQEIANGWTVWVAEADQGIVGFLAFQNICLEQLWVTPAKQSHGIGRKMLDFVKVHLHDGFWLTTSVESRGACRFYEREGLVRGEITIHPRLGHQIVRYDWRPS